MTKLDLIERDFWTKSTSYGTSSMNSL
jgi:hypothetical protein